MKEDDKINHRTWKTAETAAEIHRKTARTENTVVWFGKPMHIVCRRDKILESGLRYNKKP